MPCLLLLLPLPSSSSSSSTSSHVHAQHVKAKASNTNNISNTSIRVRSWGRANSSVISTNLSQPSPPSDVHAIKSNRNKNRRRRITTWALGGPHLKPQAPPPPPPDFESGNQPFVEAIPDSGQTTDTHTITGLPKRWVIVLLCFSSFLLCNMDRANMSIAILSMSAEFNWSPSTIGLIQSSFFWGYLLTQIAGGI